MPALSARIRIVALPFGRGRAASAGISSTTTTTLQRVRTGVLF
jgi:hypothetical protein